MELKRTMKIFSVMALAILVLATSALAAYQERVIWTRTSGIAGETLTAGQVVCIKSADGLVYKASAADATLRPAVGIITRGGAINTRAEIMLSGIMTGWTTQTKGAPGFLSTAGLITQTSPGYSQQVGIALNATDYVFSFPRVATGVFSDWTTGGGAPIVVSQTFTQSSQAGSGTLDVTGSSITLPATWFGDKKTLKWSMAGTKTGANNAMVVTLWLKDAAVVTLTAPGATAVNWYAEFTLYGYTDTAHQRGTGYFLSNAAALVVSTAASTKDLSASQVAKCQITSANAGDTVTVEYCRVDHWIQ